MEPSTLHSEPQPVTGMTAMRRLLSKLQARKEWEAANPELAALWTEAMAEDAHRDALREAGRMADRMRQEGPGRLQRLGVPSRVARALVCSPTATPALQAARDWWQSPRAILLLHGGVGSGKTLAAAWCLLRQLEQEAIRQRPSGGVPHESALFVTAPEFNGLSDYSAESRAWLERVMHCGLLVLDDLGTERMGDGELSCIQRVVSERHAAGRRTVLTTNLDTEVFKTRYGARVSDRIREAGLVKGSGKESLRAKPEARAT